MTSLGAFLFLQGDGESGTLIHPCDIQKEVLKKVFSFTEYTFCVKKKKQLFGVM